MLVLYTKSNCPYCEKVKSSLLEHNVSYEERNIENESYLEEAKGYGARTMPCMVDDGAHMVLKDSSDIVDYIEETYS
jgi:glutaredoxin-like protein NrdH